MASTDLESEKQTGNLVKYLKRFTDNGGSSNFQIETGTGAESISSSSQFPTIDGGKIILASTSYEWKLISEFIKRYPKNSTKSRLSDLELTDKDRKILVEQGPFRENSAKYRIDAEGKKFSDKYYTRTLANSEEIKRDWPVYSSRSDSVYCFCFKLFPGMGNEVKLVSKEGYSDWQNLSNSLKHQESSSVHINNFKKWKDMTANLMGKNTIDNQIEILYDLE
ncbi:hypothetical protein JTB14_002817 [Gonioctena quinquepunctata]|nr:hypothetical protein JTB14_002817 [Gonioctena quinquepunctata]